MRVIIISELLEISNNKIKTNYRVLNLDDQEPILNNRLGFIQSLNKYVTMKVDKSDTSGRTIIMETDEILDGNSIQIQYTCVVDLSSLVIQPVITTEKSILESKVIKLNHKPSNLFGLCPILNFGQVLVRSSSHAISIKVQTAPCGDDKSGKSIRLVVSDESFSQLKGKEVTIQYIRERTNNEVFDIVIPCTEIVTFNNGLLTLSNKISNIDGESPFLNFELASTVSKRSVDFMVTKLGDNTCSSLAFNAGDIEFLQGQQVLVQYLKLINPKTVTIDSDLLDISEINGVKLKYSPGEYSYTSNDMNFEDMEKNFTDTSTENVEIVEGEYFNIGDTLVD